MKNWKNQLIRIAVLSVILSLISGCSLGEPAADTKAGEETEAEGNESTKTESASQTQNTDKDIAYSFRTQEKTFQICGKDGKWTDITPIGVNIGAGRPGAFPGEFAITKNDYMSKSVRCMPM